MTTAGTRWTGAPIDGGPPSHGPLDIRPVRPYRGWLVLVFVAMLIEIAMSLAAPWPLKIVLDDALGNHRLPEALAWAHDYGIGRHTMAPRCSPGIATLLIAIIGAVATYIDNYYTTSIGQWVATTCASASTGICTVCRCTITTAPRPAP